MTWWELYQLSGEKKKKTDKDEDKEKKNQKHTEKEVTKPSVYF